MRRVSAFAAFSEKHCETYLDTPVHAADAGFSTMVVPHAQTPTPKPQPLKPSTP